VSVITASVAGIVYYLTLVVDDVREYLLHVIRGEFVVFGLKLGMCRSAETDDE
jgi:hypothetical protein